MTIFRTCQGCRHDKTDCPARNKMRESLKGLRVRSVKWGCKDRVSRFILGNAVWVRTWQGEAGDDEYRREILMADFPGTVIKSIGSKWLVYIKPGAMDQENEYPFETRGNGFCKIPISRLLERDAPPDIPCKFCGQPASIGHVLGYSCNLARDAAA